VTQQTSVIRYIWFGQISHARPVTVVEDRDDLIALHLAAGTKIKACNAPGDMSPFMNSVLSRRWNLDDVEWEWNNVLMLARPDEWFSIWGFWNVQGRGHLGWYVNLEEPITRSGQFYNTRDLQLDIVIMPDGKWFWKDEAEFAEMCELGLITADEAARVRSDGERVIDMLERGDTWWLEWNDWAPDPSWTIPTFPPGWDAV
jgi:predicted RNA-binding protein associated with RNAse of E/G family